MANQENLEENEPPQTPRPKVPPQVQAAAVNASAPGMTTREDTKLEEVVDTEETADSLRREDYIRFTGHLWQQRNNSESQADNLILTLSSAFLALSVALLKDVAPPSTMVDFTELFCSWCFFGFAILSTLASFFMSRVTIDKSLKAADIWVVDGDIKPFASAFKFTAITTANNFLSAIFFLLGLFFTVIFVGANVNHARTHPSSVAPVAQIYITPGRYNSLPVFGTTPPRPPAPQKPRPPRVKQHTVAASSDSSAGNY